MTDNKELADAWAVGYRAGNLDGYFGTHASATNPYTGVNAYVVDVPEFEHGDRVIVQGTMYYNGERGVLSPASDDPGDFWDFYVVLDSGHRIGVADDQIRKA